MNSWTNQNWQHVIEIHRAALVGIIANLCAMIGLSGDAKNCLLSPAMRKQVLRILLPAESAARRLIYILARNLEAAFTARPNAKFPHIAPNNKSDKSPTFRLYDPPKNFAHLYRRKIAKVAPRISFFHTMSSSVRTTPVAKPEPSGTPIIRRLVALRGALENLPRQAKRMAKQIERKQASRRASKPAGLIMPIRPGYPPGHRKDKTHPVDDTLYEADSLMRYLANAPP